MVSLLQRAARCLLTLALLVIGAAATTEPAWASPPTDAPPANEITAGKLHEQAKIAFRDGLIGQAAELWREAFGQHRHWKYAYNCANAMFEDGDSLPAWQMLDTAATLGMPPEYQPQLAELRAKIRDALKATRAYVVIEVEPADATVTRNDVSWEAPRAIWTLDRKSRLVIERSGYRSRVVEREHPPGTLLNEKIVLELAPTVGTLVVSGSPAGATVSVDGLVVGRLPLNALSLPVGEHLVEVRHSGHTAVGERVIVPAGDEVELRVELTAIAGAAPSPYRTAAWSTLGAGLGALALGTGLVVWSELIAQDLDDLNRDPVGLAARSYADYTSHYESEETSYMAARASGYTLGALGLAAIVSGAVLFTLDPADDAEVDAPPEADPPPAVPSEPDVEPALRATSGGR
jgi:hypothetical protein